MSSVIKNSKEERFFFLFLPYSLSREASGCNCERLCTSQQEGLEVFAKKELALVLRLLLVISSASRLCRTPATHQLLSPN